MTTKNINNLDLIRLLAAFQVVFGHSVSHLDINTSIVNFLNSWVGIFPGVPIFFVISGFLIVSSYQKSPSYFEYIRNRFLRIYPGLWLCFLITLLIVIGFGLFTAANLKQIILWSLCQLSFFQFYNPDFLRGFGVGVINGSLWTITVELQFYLIAPVLAYLLKKRIHFFIFLFLLMLIVNIISGFLPVADVPDHKYAFVQLIHRLYNVSFVPYLYFFMLGALIKWYWRQLSFLFEGRVAIWLFGYLLLFLLVGDLWQFGGLYANPIINLVLVGCVMSFAYSYKGIGYRILRNQDISYGVYIYHMLVVNILVHFGLKGSYISLLAVFIITSVLAMFSWFGIEKIAIRKKHYTIKKLKIY